MSDVVIVGGLGHVGLPLGLVLAQADFEVVLYDVDKARAELVVHQRKMPFIEHGAQEILETVLGKQLHISLDPQVVSSANTIIIAIGTPVDEYLNPKTRALFELMDQLSTFLRPEHTIIIRSTVYPRTCKQLIKQLTARGGEWHVAYCPERIAQGYAVRELREFPQIVSGNTARAVLCSC